MTAKSVTVGTDWTLLVDLQNKYVKNLTISRESAQILYVAYAYDRTTPSVDAAPEWIVTESFLGIDTKHIPSGGQIYARFLTEEESVVVNYD